MNMRSIGVNNDITLDFNLTPVGDFTGSVQGVVTLIGNYTSDEPIYVQAMSEFYSLLPQLMKMDSTQLIS